MLEAMEVGVFAASLAVVAVCLLLRRFTRKSLEDDGKRYPPSLPVLPVVGVIVRGGMTKLPEHFMRSVEKHGPVFSFRLGTRLVLVLNSYDAIYDALVRHAEPFADRNSLWLETNLMHREQRGFMNGRYTDAFKKYHKLSLSILKEFGFGVQGVTETRILQEVETMNEEIRKQNGRSFDPKWLMTFYTSNVSLGIMFGKNFMQSLPNDHSTIVSSSAEFVSNFDTTVNLAPLVRFIPMFGKKIKALRAAGKSLMSSIEVGIEFIKSQKDPESTFVGRFLEIEGADYDHQDLIYILRDLVFGSTDTVSTTMEWAMIELANNPRVQQRIQTEIDEIVPGDRLPSLDDKQRLPFSEAVILEVMRLRTVSPILLHATLRDTKVLDDDVPNDCMVIANIYSVHMDQQFWTDPEIFRPERFLDKDNTITNTKRVIPFGLGKRSCIGEILGRQSVFLFLASLVQQFDIRPPEGQDKIIAKEVITVVMASTPFKICLIPRIK